MASGKLPPNVYAQKYVTKGGRKRTLFYVRFKDWKGIRRKVPAGDNLVIARKLRERLLGLNTLRHDFDADRRPPLVFDIWARHWLSLGQHKQTANKDQISVRRLVEFFGRCQLQEITPSRVEEFKAWRRGQKTRYGGPPRPATINRELAVLRSMILLAERDGLLDKRPTIRLIPEHNERERTATEAEYQTILALIPQTHRPALVMLWELGMRESEPLRLEWSCVDFDREMIRIEHAKAGPRTVPMSPAVKRILLSIERQGERIFDFSRHSLLWHFRQAARKAGIRDLRIHDLRRSFITRKLAEGWDYKRIMLIAGLKSLTVFDRRYSKPLFESLREVVAGGHRGAMKIFSWPQEEGEKSAST